MNKFLFNSRFSFVGFIVLLSLTIIPELAFAQEFSLENIVPESIAEKPFLELIMIILAMVIMVTVVVVLGFGTTGAIADVFQTLSESRRMGDWGTFMKTLGIVIAVVIAATVLAVLVWTWMSTIDINPTVTFGG